MKKFLISVFVAATAVFYWLSPAPAMELKALNRVIEQTNFIVNNGCSGTLISVSEKLVLTNYHCIDSLVSVVDKEVTNDEGFVKKVKAKKYSDVGVSQYT